MSPSIWFSESATLEVEEFVESDECTTVIVHAIGAAACCPVCGNSSGRIHSRYTRKLADVPWQGKAVQVQLRARRFFCDTETCPRKVFAERLTEFVPAYGRATSRLQNSQRHVGFAIGGEAGSRLAFRLGMPVSADTLLRRMRSTALDEPPPPRVVGVDDWALRRGLKYGTILCDLERRRAIDLLPDRSAAVLRRWLQAHPQVEVVSRDRAGDYAKGAAEGAPQAIQVADRWHLLHNLRQALTHLVDRHHIVVRESVQAVSKVSTSQEAAKPREKELAPLQPTRVTKAQERQQFRRARRVKLYEDVLELDRQGMSRRSIARRLQLDRGTVQRYLRAGSFPERASRYHPVQTLPYEAYLAARWQAGCRNAVQLYRELRAQGFAGSYFSVRRRVASWRRADANCPDTGFTARPARARPPPKRITEWLLKPDRTLTTEERLLIHDLTERCPELKQASHLARQFVSIIRRRRRDAFEDWKAQAREAAVAPELRQFAEELVGDQDAVKAALTLPWSNGFVEGQINRLKTLKRQMYGRANFDLLRRRFLFAP